MAEQGMAVSHTATMNLRFIERKIAIHHRLDGVWQYRKARILQQMFVPNDWSTGLNEYWQDVPFVDGDFSNYCYPTAGAERNSPSHDPNLSTRSPLSDAAKPMMTDDAELAAIRINYWRHAAHSNCACAERALKERDALTARNTELEACLIKWAALGRLETYEDRERFRAAVLAFGLTPWATKGDHNDRP